MKTGEQVFIEKLVSSIILLSDQPVYSKSNKLGSIIIRISFDDSIHLLHRLLSKPGLDNFCKPASHESL